MTDKNWQECHRFDDFWLDITGQSDYHLTVNFTALVKLCNYYYYYTHLMASFAGQLSNMKKYSVTIKPAARQFRGMETDKSQQQKHSWPCWIHCYIASCKVLWWICLKTIQQYYNNFCTCCLWLWLSSPLPALQCIMYFPFCGWRHVFIP